LKRPLASFLLLLLLPLSTALADVPVRSEQLIWSILAFNGRDYSPTFTPESSDTIYIVAGSDNIFSAQKTLLYWWPITSEWKTDATSLNVQFPGTLELRDSRGKVTRNQLQEYTYFNVKGRYEQNWKVVTGEAALTEVAKYKTLYAAYFDAVRDFQTKSAAYDNEIQSLSSRIQELRGAGMDVASLLTRMKTLHAPEEPARPAYYAVPPVELQQAFILNLGPGSYSIRLVNPDGSVMEGAEKRLIVHDKRRANGIGFEVIPSDKWTRPETSVTPSSVVYVDGSADLYLQPFFEEDFNDLAYEKTRNNAALGNPNIFKWVRIQQVPQSHIVLAKAGAIPVTLAEQPFLVEQATGSSLGYTIVPFDPAGAQKDKEPSLIAFRVAVDRNVPVMRFHALDGAGAPLEGSERHIRVVGKMHTGWLLLVLSLMPLLVMGIVLYARAGSYKVGSP
jgi:hypothetical protein